LSLSRSGAVRRLFSADVVSDFVLKRDERVRNDLFVRRIDLSFRAREKEIVSTREERIEIFLRLEVQTVKSPSSSNKLRRMTSTFSSAAFIVIVILSEAKNI